MNKTIWIRSLLLLLSLVMTLSCIACKTDGNTEDSANNVEVDTGPYADLPKTSFEGREIVVATRVDWGADWTYDAYSGDQLNDVMYERNLAFETTYDCDIITVEDNNIHQIIYQSYMSDSKDFDLIYPHPTTGIGLLMESGSLANLKASNILDFSGEGWNQYQVENYTTNGKLFLAVPDASIHGQGFGALVYNRDLYNSYGFDVNIHETVMNGEWTAEVLQSILLELASENEGSSKVYGLIDNHAGTYGWIYALGGSILTKNDDGEFLCGLNQTSIVALCDAFLTIEDGGDYMLVGSSDNANYPTSEMWTSFTGNKGLFIRFDVGASSHLLRNLSFDEGYAPQPMANKEQGDYRVFCGAGFYAIPSKCQSFEQSCILLEYAAIHGAAKLKPVFFETIINGRLAENPEDSEMLNLLHDSKIFDFGFTLDASSNLITNYLRDNVYVTKSSGGAAVWLMQNQNLFNKLIATANELGQDTE